MAKGVASPTGLKALAHPLARFIATWGAGQRPAKPGNALAWPAAYELAALRGEGVLRERFFNPFMVLLPVQLEASQQVALWHELVEGAGHITAWVQRLGLAAALRRETVLPEHAAHESRKLYALLLDVLHQQQPQLLEHAVEAYFYHVWKQRFPDKPVAAHSKAVQADVLRDKVLRALRKRHGSAAELRESFKEQGANGDAQADANAVVAAASSVRFALLCRPSPAQPWQELVALERPRLKTARVAAYDAAHKSLQAAPL
jgi:hypothetical protein